MWLRRPRLSVVESKPWHGNSEVGLEPFRGLARGAAASVVSVAMGLALAGCGGRDVEPGAISDGPRPAASVADEQSRQAEVASAPGTILFGDLHVHTAYSIDAYVFALPLFGGEGVGPPADACDFARHCAALDFFSINDHAEALTPERWQATRDSIRECNERAGDPSDPDLVAFVGYEWTQAGKTPETHFGHKNVIFRGVSDDDLPARPITSLPQGTIDRARGVELLSVLDVLPRMGTGVYGDFLWWVGRMAQQPDCGLGVDTNALPPDCRENADTPDLLFEKLAQGGLDPIVIPHGLAWGVHAPPGSTIRNQLTRASHDVQRQTLLEVYSGHGNSEEYRPLPDTSVGADESGVCPAPSDDYLACCWQAGEIVRARCGELPERDCETRVDEARRLAMAAGTSPHLVLPDTRPEDWLDCDQCRDCFKPAMNLRPGESAQYALAVSNFDEPADDGTPLRFRFGFIASSDNHSARPGTGYKQRDRLETTDARGIASPGWERWVRPYVAGEQEDPQRAQAAPDEQRGFRGLLDVERGASFMYPGGLVAVHSQDRSREAIWEALEAKRVYGTSGPRILLWFDLVNGPDGRAPMGSEVVSGETPRFAVHAVGSFVQQPGCPDASRVALGDERLERLCRNECYQPGDARRAIRAIEVVRVRPQHTPDAAAADGIEDPWRVFACEPDPTGCRVRFEDPDYARSGRDAVYYVRALEEPSLAVNGAMQRAVRDAAGEVVRTDPCHGGYRTPADDDCLAPVQERAWSSPIYLDQPRAAMAASSED